MQTLVLGIEGMSCQHCEAALEGAIQKLPGVISAKADKDKANLTVQYDPSLLNPADIEKNAQDTGFDIK